MTNTCSNLKHSLVPQLMLAGLVLATPALLHYNAADAGLQDNLELARNTLQELDRLAGICLEGEDSQADPTANPCREFNQAINGDLLVQYLGSCNVARSWREEFVTQQLTSPATTQSGNADENLESLVAVEFLCGEGALLKRTSSVAGAYQLTRRNSDLASISSRSFDRQLNELEQQSTLSQERNEQMENMQRMQQRQQLETSRQFEQLELELLRQNLPR